MGIVIGAEDWSHKVSPVSPMPVPEYNVLVAIQTLASGKVSSIAVSTIGRSTGLVINDITVNMPELLQPITHTSLQMLIRTKLFTQG